MTGFIDLHLHYIPNVDDGVRSEADSILLLEGLYALGYRTSIATPHIRRDLFPNERPTLVSAFESLRTSLASREKIPSLGLGAEHWVDETLLARVVSGEAIPYPGGKSILVELPPSAIPMGVVDLCFRLRAKGLLPVLAHPERYSSLFERTDPLHPLIDRGVAVLLDLMSLVGRYGRAPQRAAERMLDEGVVDAACSDAHVPGDVAHVERALATLERRVGRAEAERLLKAGPERILSGSIEF